LLSAISGSTSIRLAARWCLDLVLAQLQEGRQGRAVGLVDLALVALVKSVVCGSTVAAPGAATSTASGLAAMILRVCAVTDVSVRW
jgi:hypothetical protein